MPREWDNHREVGEALLQLVKRRGFTQTHVLDWAKGMREPLSKPHLSQVLNGKREIKPRHVGLIAGTLDMDRAQVAEALGVDDASYWLTEVRGREPRTVPLEQGVPDLWAEYIADEFARAAAAVGAFIYPVDPYTHKAAGDQIYAIGRRRYYVAAEDVTEYIRGRREWDPRGEEMRWEWRKRVARRVQAKHETDAQWAVARVERCELALIQAARDVPEEGDLNCYAAGLAHGLRWSGDGIAAETAAEGISQYIECGSDVKRQWEVLDSRVAAAAQRKVDADNGDTNEAAQAV